MALTVRLNISLELAKHNSVYEDIASKFIEQSVGPDRAPPDRPASSSSPTP